MDFHVHQSEDAIYTVYKITGPTGKLYIGCTKMKPEKRWNSGYGYRQHPYFFHDIKKYGWGSFQKEIICERLLKEGAEKLEKFLVDYYDTCDPEKGYNVFSGGNRKGATLSAAGRERNSIKVKAAYANNPEYRALMKKYRLAEFSEQPESLQKLRDSIRKLNQDPEYRRKMSEVKRKYYETHSLETDPIAVMCLDTGEVFSSMNKAERITGGNHGAIGLVCRKKRHTAGGLHWKFREETDTDKKGSSSDC